MQCEKQVMDANARFATSLPDHAAVEKKSFVDKLQANNNFDEGVPLLLHNGMPQSELVKEINRTESECEFETSSVAIAIAIACACSLKDLEGVSDSVCLRLVELLLTITINLNAQDMIKFLKRCPNLVSLTVTDIDNCDETFLKQVFQEKLLPKLETLKVSLANDDAIEVMSSAPNLKRITFQSPDDRNVTNDGFDRLVMAGGGKNLVYISVRGYSRFSF